jgi:hypothetical protein
MSGDPARKIHRSSCRTAPVAPTFWLIAQHGRRTNYDRNLESDPRVRVRVSADRNWMTWIAHILDSDDAGARRRELGQGNGWRRLCLSASHAMSTNPLTIRIDLDQAETGK